MSDERKQVLEMLAAGKITAEQADRLLEALQPRTMEPAVAQSETPRFRRERRPSGLSPEVRKLMEARMHGVSASFVHEMESVGFKNLGLAQLTEMRIHGVGADFAREMQQLMGDLTPHDLIELRIHGLNPQFIDEMRELGLTDLSIEDLIQMRRHGLTGHDLTTIRSIHLDDESDEDDDDEIEREEREVEEVEREER